MTSTIITFKFKTIDISTSTQEDTSSLDAPYFDGRDNPRNHRRKHDVIILESDTASVHHSSCTFRCTMASLFPSVPFFLSRPATTTPLTLFHLFTILSLVATQLSSITSFSFIDTTKPIRTSTSSFFKGGERNIIQPARRLTISIAGMTTTMTTTKKKKTMEGKSSSSLPLSMTSSLTTIPLSQGTNLQAIIFDIDGTLADSWKLGFDATLVVLERNGLPPITEELYHECTKFSTPQRLARHAGFDPDNNNNDNDSSSSSSTAVQKFDPIEYEIVGQRLAAEFDDLYVGLVTTTTAGFFPGIGTLVQTKIPSRIKIGALTNACVAYAHAVLRVNNSGSSGTPMNTVVMGQQQQQRLGNENDDGGRSTGMISIQERFQSIHGADTVPAPKPEPDGLLLVCQELDVEPQCAVYVGDSPSDAMAAHASGMPSIGVTWGSHSEESLRNAPFTYICSDVDDLCRVLNLI
jgi:phosphoglycolate phosphatase-like HAD superfamily hydrolase